MLLRGAGMTNSIAHRRILLFPPCPDRTGGGARLRLGSSSTSTALWPSSLSTLTSAPSGRRVRLFTQSSRLVHVLVRSSSDFCSRSLTCRSSRGIQTPRERRPVLHAAPPPRRHPGVTLHSRGTALPSRGNTGRDCSLGFNVCL